MLKENVSIQYEMGVFLDVFPLNNLDDSFEVSCRITKKGSRYNQMLSIKTITWQKERSFLRNCLLMFDKTFLLSISIAKKLDDLEICAKENESKSFTNFVGVLTSILKGDQSCVFERSWFENARFLPFEGKEYPCPVGANNIKTIVWGIYDVSA